MGSSTRHFAAVALLALGAQGCITGHLLDAARRYERPITYHDAFVDRDRLLLVYTVLVADHFGQPLERKERGAAITLADLRRDDVPVESFPVEHLADVPHRGQRVVLHADGRPVPPPPFIEVDETPDGQPLRLVLHDAQDGTYAPFYSSALTRTHTAPWVYPLLPFSLAFDVATNPVLLFFAPAVMVLGD